MWLLPIIGKHGWPPPDLEIQPDSKHRSTAPATNATAAAADTTINIGSCTTTSITTNTVATTITTITAVITAIFTTTNEC